MTPATVVKPLTPARLPHLADLFGTSKVTSGCYCMWFLLPSKQCQAGWNGGNKDAFEDTTRTERQPMGLLAYRSQEAVGWAAIGPRSRYDRALRSRLMRDTDRSEDGAVWLVPCFYVRRDARKQGVTRQLLEAAVDLAQRKGARAIEGFPLAGDGRHSTGEAFLGVEPLFASCGFEVIARPSAKRVLMRRTLS